MKRGDSNMNKTKLNCSLNDTSILRNLILENPELPVLIFCGEEAYCPDYSYTMAYSSKGEIEELSLYNDEQWLNYDDYREELTESLSDNVEHENLSDEEYEKMIDMKMKKIEFVKAIVLWVG